MISHQRLLSCLRYNSYTGEFAWIDGPLLGRPAGTLENRRSEKYPHLLPYWRIAVDGKVYYRSKLAWFYVTGEWPLDEIDHRDRNSLNDSWPNLRPATRAQNNANRRAFKNNRSGQKGVHAFRGKWRAMISVGGKNRHIGYFATKESASVAYFNAAKEAFGEFASAA